MILKGTIYALSACFIWGLIFVVPQFMNSFSSIEITIGRYLFYGSISLLLLLKARLKGLCHYPLSVWLKAFGLSFLSAYYLWLILGIRYTSPAVCALILGTSPITIALYGNWSQKESSFKLLIAPSFLILAGLIMINAPHITMINSPWEYTIGLISSFWSLISWSLYVVLNSRFLKKNPQVISNDWATMQGVTTLLWTFFGGLVACIFLWNDLDMQKYVTWNYDLGKFYMGCAILGLLCSWVGAFLWNKASFYLPVSLAGQLMIFETIFGIIFVYLIDQQLPPLMESAGILLLLGAVVYGIRTISPQPSHA